MLLAQTPKECVVFHPNNTHRQFLSDVLMGFAEAGITLKRVESEEFQQALDRMMDNPDLITLLRPLMATYCRRLRAPFCGYHRGI